MNVDRPILVISDLQIPFEHNKALEFCIYLKRHFNVPSENVLNVGDEIDALHGGAWPKNPDGSLSAVGEIAQARNTIKEWGAHFPLMKLCISNHGLRWIRKATAAEIPSQLLRSYEQIFEMPEGWKWQQEWRFMNLKHPFRMIHGMGYSGIMGHRNAAIDAGISTVIGHLHANAGINQIKPNGLDRRIWGMNVGCLIDIEAYAFEYEKYNRIKPCLGAGIIFNEGKTPVWMPLE